MLSAKPYDASSPLLVQHRHVQVEEGDADADAVFLAL